MTSKPTKEQIAQERAALLTIAQAVLEDYFKYLPLPLDADASKEWERLQMYIAKRKQKLLAPPVPKPPRKQDSKSPAALELEHLQRTQTTGTVIPVPQGLQPSVNAITKRVRRTGNGGS